MSIPDIPCALFNLRKTARVVSQLYDRLLLPSGLKATQYSLLRVIGLVPATISSIASSMEMDRTTVARNVGLLERKGYVQIVAGSDRRTRHLLMTRKGEDAVINATHYWQQAQTLIVGDDGFGVERWLSLRAELEGLTEAGRNALEATEHSGR